MRSAFDAITYDDGEVFAHQRDPYAWFNPVEEIEEWVCRCAEEHFKREQERYETRERHQIETAHMRAQIQSMLEKMASIAMLSPMPPFFVTRGEIGRHVEALAKSPG